MVREGECTMIERYKDFYGCSASIRPVSDGFKLVCCLPNGRKVRDQIFATHRGAVRAMQNDSDDTMRRAEAGRPW
jgi:hypothetical protein